MVPFFCTKNEKNDFEENKFNEKIWWVFSFFTSKGPLTLSVERVITLQMFADKGLINYYFCMLLLHMKMCKLFKGY